MLKTVSNIWHLDFHFTLKQGQYSECKSNVLSLKYFQPRIHCSRVITRLSLGDFFSLTFSTFFLHASVRQHRLNHCLALRLSAESGVLKKQTLFHFLCLLKIVSTRIDPLSISPIQVNFDSDFYYYILSFFAKGVKLKLSAPLINTDSLQKMQLSYLHDLRDLIFPQYHSTPMCTDFGEEMLPSMPRVQALSMQASWDCFQVSLGGFCCFWNSP